MKSPRHPKLPGVEAVILAGGLSSRMGRDKAAARLGGRSLLSIIRRTAGEAGLRVRVIRRDLVPRCGPLGGVWTALKRSEAGTLLFLSCDMPLVSPEWLERVLGTLSGGRRAVFTEEEGRPGFPFALKAETLPVVAELIECRCLALRDLARVLEARRLRAPKRLAAMLLNVNTPEDLQRARAFVRRTGKQTSAQRQVP